MTEPLEQILGLLTTSPGNLAYYLALSFTILAALQAAINTVRETNFPQGRRLMTGLGLLFLLQLAQFAVAGLAWLGLLDTELWLPPVDRAVILISILVIIWLWLAPVPSRLADTAFGLLLILAAAFFIFSSLWWNEQAPQVYYNATLPDWGWNLFAITLLGGGMLALVIRRPASWGIGLAMLALLFAGQLFHFILPQMESDYSGAVRLGQLMAFPWLMSLSQRFSLTASRAAPAAPPKVAERRRYTADPRAFQEFVSLLDQTADCRTITRLISQLMLADVCLFVTSDESSNDLTIACGYNLIEEKWVEGFSVSGNLVPTLLSALKRGKPLRLPASSTSTDLHALASGLHMARAGHLLAVPITQNGSMGLVLISPFSNRGWGSEDQAILFKYARFLNHVVQRTQESTRNESDWNALQTALQAAEEAKQQLTEQLRALQAQISAMQLSTSETAVAGSAQSGAAHSNALPSEGEVSLQAYEELQAHLRLALEQIAELRQELARAKEPPTTSPTTNQAGLETLLQPEGQVLQPALSSANDHAAIANLVQELNQPVASILGYIDLLLGESIGILGAMQKKFLERIRVSVERMGGLMDDLLQLTAINQEEFKVKPQKVHLIPVINAAISQAIEELRQKEIQLHIELPEALPVIQADEKSIQQVILSLLKNAGDRSHRSGEVRLKTKVEIGEHETGFIMVQISDRGEGIPPQDLPRVFSRVYAPAGQAPSSSRQERLDLASIKTIIEAHGGRIWVDSTPGEGSTFSMLLPIPGE